MKIFNSIKLASARTDNVDCVKAARSGVDTLQVPPQANYWATLVTYYLLGNPVLQIAELRPGTCSKKCPIFDAGICPNNKQEYAVGKDIHSLNNSQQ